MNGTTTHTQSRASGRRSGRPSRPSTSPNPSRRRAERTSTCSRCSRTRPGSLHMGHVLNYTLGDVVTHFQRRNGYEVLRPMGFDSFGLPAENAAIKDGGHPLEITERNIEAIRIQMRRMGWAIDWQREVSAHEPTFYRWTQWLFLKFFEHGLAYRKEAPVNWCPNDQTVLVERARRRRPLLALRRDRRDAEHGAVVLQDHRVRGRAARRPGDDRLARAHEEDPDATRSAARRARRSLFRVDELDLDIPVFTTRPDTLFGATFFVGRARVAARRQQLAGRQRRGAHLRAHRRRAAHRGARGAREDRRLHRALRDEPGQRRAAPDLGRRLRADGVRHRRDHGRARARRARPRVRRDVRAADSSR